TTADPHLIARQEIINVLVTDKGERVMASTYGAGTSSLLFEPVDALVEADFKDGALAMLNNHLSNAVAVGLTVTTKSPDGSYSGLGESEATMYVNVNYKLIGDVGTNTISVGIVNPLNITALSPL
ncbi:MAG: hypothetical protein CL489_02950, partial [Acidobacteria bacterium]|nr:hypothetical protein [Acidobacteriota bacterium]